PRTRARLRVHPALRRHCTSVTGDRARPSRRGGVSKKEISTSLLGLRARDLPVWCGSDCGRAGGLRPFEIAQNCETAFLLTLYFEIRTQEMQATSAVNPSESSRPAVPRIGVGGCQISERGKALVMQVLDSNRLSAGPMMDRFEKEIARLHGRRHGLMCNSGTSALQIALAALKEREGWSDGDEVLVPAITFIATSNSVLFNH